MNCPVCRSETFSQVELDPGLSALRCESCAGKWVRGGSYWQWLGGHGANLPERHEPPAGEAPPEDRKAKLCPECHTSMFRYTVGHGLGFGLDQCPACKGIWFDAAEWEALRGRNLHDDIHAVFTAPWQAEASREERRRRLEQIYTKRFGAEDFAEVRRVRDWLDASPRKQELLAYLTDPNPWSV
ncbi:MAG TPA: zf-TFIIB domain-containing protein [Pyrinomonadaceae bacterium]|jgi:Zn-finger nucleic acid-binding protein